MQVIYQVSGWVDRLRSRFNGKEAWSGTAASPTKKTEHELLNVKEFIQEELVKQRIKTIGIVKRKIFATRKHGLKTPVPFRFMSLPPEIRIMIYEYCLVVVGEIVPYPTDAERKDLAMCPRYEMPTLALLQVNQKIGNEARAILYGKNMWRLSFQTYPRLPDTVWEKNLHLFRLVSVSLDHRDVTEFTKQQFMSAISNCHWDNMRFGDSSSRIAGDIQRHVRLAYGNTFMSICRWKIETIQMMLPSLRFIAVDFRHAMHPSTYERPVTLHRIKLIPLWPWATRRGTPHGSTFERPPQDQQPTTDPLLIRPMECTMLQLSGLSDREADYIGW
ncbi:MAG: hypothetical protein Q9225_007015 [Loekoesia sp. 1 TL-2023]